MMDDLAEDLYRACESGRARLVINLISGMGHMAAEFDNFRRMKALGELDRTRAYILAVPPDPKLTDFIALFGGAFDKIICDADGFDAARQVIAKRPDFAVDIGISDYKIQPMVTGLSRASDLAFMGPSFLHSRTTKLVTLSCIRAYYGRYAASHALPLLPPPSIPSPALDQLINHGNGRPLAVIAIKSRAGNATPDPTDPHSLLPLLGRLRDEGLRCVLAGREAMPDIFRPFGLIDYPGSDLTSIAHDFGLFARADLAIINGSGLSHLPDLFGVPYIFANSWHVGVPMPSARCVEVPARVIESTTRRRLTFTEQVDLFLSGDPYGPWDLDTDFYEGQTVGADDLVSAYDELAAMIRAPVAPNENQERYHQLDPLDLKCHVQSRVSAAFLDRNADFIN
jgi:putative glycosyltransferase (TIGR04372 family)